MDKEAKDLKSFLAAMPITKDVGSLRKKGIMLEDALWLLREKLELEAIHSFREGNYEQMVYEGEGVRVAWAYYRLSIPCLVVGVDTEERWINIRQMLKDAHLVR